jgi:hypothetical protein
MISKRVLVRAVFILAAIALFRIESSNAQLTALSIHVPVMVAGERKIIDFEPFTLWAPDGAILVNDGTRVVRQAPPNSRYYRGRSMNDGDFASLTVDGETGNATGLMVFDGKRYVLSGGTPDDDGRRRMVAIPQLTAREAEDSDIAAIAQWRCSLDGERLARTPISKVMANAAPPAEREGIAASQSYVVSLEVETDYDLYLTTHDYFVLRNYVTYLTSALAVILNRDLNVSLQLRNVHIYMTPQDNPWHVQPSEGINAALYELGDYYHTNYSSVPRSAVVLLSGKPFNAGTAWEGALCLSPRDFACSSGSCGDPAADGHYGGAYAVSGSIVGPSFIPNPNGTLPLTGFWDLQDYAHEVGHVLGGHHTNCIALTPAEQGSTGRSWVDECASDEYGCYSGGVFSPFEGGTIMGSCFNLSPTTSRYTYGSAADVSHHELDDYLRRIGGTVGGLPNVDSATTSLSLSPISAPNSVTPNSTGNIASITTVSGALYSWSSDAGEITAGADTNTVTFSAPSSGTVTLTVYLYNASGCAGLTESKTLSIVAAPPAPTGVIATAASSTSVNLWWNQVTGSSIFYTIYRSSPVDPHTFGIVGCTQQVPGSQTPYVDGASVSVNSSYLYKITAASGTFNSNCPQPSGQSAFSNIDIATTVSIPIPTIGSGVTIRSDHINYLRAATLAVHRLANGAQASLSFTDPTIGSCVSDPAHCVAIKAVHLNELRSPLTADRQTLGLPVISFTPVLTGCSSQNPSQCVVINANHFIQLMNAVQ